jgi:hypothetical protein
MGSAGGDMLRRFKGDAMLERVHQHITDELQQGARTDTVFVVTAVLFNLIVLAVNSAMADVGGDATNRENILLIIFMLMTVVINAIVAAALNTGRQTRNKLLSGLMGMYRDNEVDNYYDLSLLTNYNRRYLFFSLVIVSLALTALAVPLVIRFL